MSTFNLMKSGGNGNSSTFDDLDRLEFKPYDRKSKYPGRVNQNQQFDKSDEGPNDGGFNDLNDDYEELEAAFMGDTFLYERQNPVTAPSSAGMMDSTDVGAPSPAIGTAQESARRINDDPDFQNSAQRLPNGQGNTPHNQKRRRLRATNLNPVKTFNQLRQVQQTSPLTRAWLIQQ